MAEGTTEEKTEKKGFFREFKEFLARGNVLDLAVAVIIGAAFGAIVTSLTNDIIMPLITWATGENSLADVSVTLIPAQYAEDGITVIKEALTWNYGNFLQSIIDFIIIAFVVFLFVKAVTRLRKTSEKIGEGVKCAVKKVKEGEADAATDQTEETEKKQ